MKSVKIWRDLVFLFFLRLVTMGYHMVGKTSTPSGEIGLICFEINARLPTAPQALLYPHTLNVAISAEFSVILMIIVCV